MGGPSPSDCPHGKMVNPKKCTYNEITGLFMWIVQLALSSYPCVMALCIVVLGGLAMVRMPRTFSPT